jgi:branched-chain amino acid aminotransferase
VEQADLIWQNGELVAWEDAKVHVLTHGLHYGTGVFEGERAYETPAGPAIFRHRDHLDRLFKSAELFYMPIPFTLEELRSATHELINANELRECYIRPIVYRSTPRWRFRSRHGPGVRTSERRASSSAFAPRCRAGGGFPRMR